MSRRHPRALGHRFMPTGQPASASDPLGSGAMTSAPQPEPPTGAAQAGGLRTERRMSHVFALDVPHHAKPLFITDAAVNIAPDLDTERDIVQNAIDLARALGISLPKVAILSAIETVSSRMPSTIDAAALCKMAERGQIVGGLLDGPLAFDNAISSVAHASRASRLPSPAMPTSGWYPNSRPAICSPNSSSIWRTPRSRGSCSGPACRSSSRVVQTATRRVWRRAPSRNS